MSGLREFSLKFSEHDWDLIVDALQWSSDDSSDPALGQELSNLAVLLRNKIDTVMIAATGEEVYGGCDTITKAAKLEPIIPPSPVTTQVQMPGTHLNPDCSCTHEPGYPCDASCAVHGTITKAAQ